MCQKDMLFIINTLSGRFKKRDNLLSYIKSLFPLSEILIIQKREEFKEVIELSKNERYKYLIINGGDGTIHSFLPVIIEHNKVLGILPSGSGNGLARTLNVPFDFTEALKRIQKNHIQAIDVGKLTKYYQGHTNYNYFSCAVGFGIDAKIANRFEHQRIRGLLGYLLAGVKEIFSYKASPITVISCDRNVCQKNQFLILSIMNIPQYGNDFYLSPSAKINDGQLNLVGLKKVSGFMYPYVLFNLLMRKEKTPLEYYKIKSIEVQFAHQEGVFYHIDGEPYNTIGPVWFSVEVIPLALKVL